MQSERMRRMFGKEKVVNNVVTGFKHVKQDVFSKNRIMNPGAKSCKK